MAILGSDYLVDLELSALQAEGRGEVISSPRVITANAKQASIEQGVEIPYQESTSSGATSISFKKAVLSLTVTPQITPDERVVMDLSVSSDTVGQQVANVLGGTRHGQVLGEGDFPLDLRELDADLHAGCTSAGRESVPLSPRREPGVRPRCSGGSC